jgi:multidrug resistance efflux pump
VACAIHWFNPLAWLAAWRLRVERERACDDLVLGAGIKASDYAEHLLHVATTLEIASPAGALAMAAPSRLEGRLLAVLNQKVRRGTVSRSVAALAVILALGLIIPMAMLRADDKTALSAAPVLRPNSATGGSNGIEPSAADPSPGSSPAETSEHAEEPGIAEPKGREKIPAENPLLGSDQPVPQAKPAPNRVQQRVIVINADGTFKADGKAISAEELRDVLTQWHSNIPVVISADRTVAYAHVARVVDACCAANITTIIARPPPEAGGEANAPADKTEVPPQTTPAPPPRPAERPAENEGVESETDAAAGQAARARLRFAEQQLQRVAELERQKLVSAAELDRAKTEVEVLKAELAGDEKEVARIRLRRAERELERVTELHAQKAVSGEARDRAQLQVEVLRAELAGDQRAATRAKLQHAEREFARLSELKQQNAVSAEALDRARLELDVLRAELAADPLAARRAQLQHAERELERLLALSKQNLVSREAVDRAKAEADLRRAEIAGGTAEAAGANLKKAANELERASKLRADNLISASDFEAARANAEVARGQLNQLAPRRAASAGDERSAEILRLLDEDLRLAKEKLNILKRQQEVGVTTSLPVMQMEAELIGLRRNKAAHEGKPDEVSRLFDEQIKVLEELHRAIANGSDGDRANLAIDVQRQIVALRRQKLETAGSAATAP